MRDQELCLKEQVKDTKCTIGVIIKDEKGLREVIDMGGIGEFITIGFLL